MKRIISILIIFLITVHYLYSQNFDWYKHFGGNLDDHPHCIARHGSNLYFGGSSASDSIIFDEQIIYPQNNLFVTRLDTNGNAKWSKSFGDNSISDCFDIATDSEGFIYITGQYYAGVFSFDTIELTTNGDADVFMAKLDSLGNVVWAKNIGGSLQDQGIAIVTDKNDNLILTGIFDSPILNIENQQLEKTGDSYDIFVAKYSNNGELTWVKSINGDHADYVNNINVDNNDNIYVVGEYTSASLNTENNSITNTGNYDSFLIKYDSNGNDLFISTVKGQYDQTAKDVFIDSQNNINTCGTFTGTATDFGNDLTFDAFNYHTDSYIAQYDSTCNINWVKIISGNEQEEVGKIDYDSENNIYITGWFTGDSVIFENSTIYRTDDNPDIFIAKFDSSGNCLRPYAIGGSGWDIGIDVYINGFDEAFFINSFTSQNLIINENSLVSLGGFDILFAAMNISNFGVVNNIEIVESKLLIYPNPFSSEINIQLNKEISKDLFVEIFSIDGKIVFQKFLTNSESSIYLHSLKSGLYFLRISNSNYLMTEKILKL